MSKIKTRENSKDIKILDKSAVVGQRRENTVPTEQDPAPDPPRDGQRPGRWKRRSTP